MRGAVADAVPLGRNRQSLDGRAKQHRAALDPRGQRTHLPDCWPGALTCRPIKSAAKHPTCQSGHFDHRHVRPPDDQIDAPVRRLNAARMTSGPIISIRLSSARTAASMPSTSGSTALICFSNAGWKASSSLIPDSPSDVAHDTARQPSSECARLRSIPHRCSGTSLFRSLAERLSRDRPETA